MHGGAVAAYANGALGVLHSGGLHHPDRLAATGYPLADVLVLGCRLIRYRPLL
ncbi:hypothetical protein ACFV6F_30915 [Kitasatospora phosalacinea]|uniref:hypothetical protein n=1 Tax=Kitasatospora phosalacinea TaxID=2065 RepID=UPI00364B0278